MTLSGLELRRAVLLALGWKFYVDENQPYNYLFVRPGEADVMHYALKKYKLEEADIPLERLEGHTPAIESDPAVSEPLFLEWCARNGYWWNYGSSTSDDGLFYCNVGRWNEDSAVCIANVTCATPSEARARCIVIASAQEVTK